MTFTEFRAAHADKLKHLALGVVLYLLAGPFSVLLGMTLVLLVAWGLEEWQRKTGKGVKDGWDAYAVAVGMVPGHALVMLFGDSLKGLLVSAFGGIFASGIPALLRSIGIL